MNPKKLLQTQTVLIFEILYDLSWTQEEVDKSHHRGQAKLYQSGSTLRKALWWYLDTAKRLGTASEFSRDLLLQLTFKRSER